MEEALLKRIHQLCKGDKAKAKRLIDTAKSKNPNQSALWYLQKVISDLEQEQANYFQKRRGNLPQKQTENKNTDSWEQKVRLRQAEHCRRQSGKPIAKPQISSGNPANLPSSPPFSVPPPPPPIAISTHQLEQIKLATQPNPIKISTWNRLMVLLNGNQSTAERLIESARYRYSDKSDQWIAEKVVFDLERDRH